MFIKFLVFKKYSIFSYKLIYNEAFSSSLPFKKDLFLHISVTKIKAFN